MASILTLGNWLLPLLYLALLIDYGATFFMRTRTAVRSPWLLCVIAAHAGLLVLWSVHAGRPPLASTVEILTVLALAMAAVYALVESTNRDRRTGVFVLALVFLFQYTSSIFLGRAPEAAAAPEAGALSGWARLHVIAALVAYTALAFAGVYGLLYLPAQRALRHRRFGVLFDRLPPLDLLGRMTWHAMLVGFLFLTIAIITAPLAFRHLGGGASAEAMTPKVIAKIITGSVAWIIYLVATLGRAIGKWSPARIATIAVAGFAVVLCLLISSGLLW
jgi:ABC-type uncharacterized transport system permease subunit